MKPFWIFSLMICAPAIAQITSISAPHFGGITTITPTYNGYSYTTIGGPHSGDFGNVQVTGGNVSAVAVTPRGGTYPIVTPAPVIPPPLPSLDLDIPPPQPIFQPIFQPDIIPIPVAALAPKTTPYPKSKANAERKEFDDLFARITLPTARKKFWDDFYNDWRVAPKTPIPTRFVIPYLKLWIRDNPEQVR